VIAEYGEHLGWLKVRTDYDSNSYNKLISRFGPGESSCIALAQNEDNPLLIIDDRKARRIAEEIGIECTGSLGVLLIAKREKVISKVKPLLDKIKKTNFRITEELVNEILMLVGEN
jgi:predicted nucleic acid-binding protein